MSRLHWIDTQRAGRLAIMARPCADDWLEVEVDAWKAAGVEQVLSLLEAEEVSELGLWAEADTCRERGIVFLSFPIPDRGMPDAEAARQIAGKLARDVAAGHIAAIHCRAGIGRSSLMAACVLMLLGHAPGEALALIRDARGVPVPDTDEQRDWIMAFSRAEP
jgi:protein-tyrosine phosphatase